MEINYEEQNIENAQGSGKPQRFVRLRHRKALTVEEIENRIEQSTTLTRADVRGVLAELRRVIVDSLCGGRRFHLQGIGYLSLSAGLALPEERKEATVTGKDIYLRGINFLPEEKLLNTIKKQVSFHKSDCLSKSITYTAEELWPKVESYLSSHQYLTTRIMREEFVLGKNKALEWLTKWVEDGHLTKQGTHHLPIYFRKPD